ncbi:hypothetical protein NDA13_004028 [Ustilago tritici]|nr:hypothetical protein NDA13_004028 [Ustilago tritici]
MYRVFCTDPVTLSLSPTTKRWERMTYDDCLLVPGLVTNLIGTKTVTQVKGKVTFEDVLVTVQDRHGRAIGVPISSNGYPAAGMILWDDNMPNPKVSLAFTGMWQWKTRLCKDNTKANLWHRCLGHPGHDAILCTQSATTAHDIPLAQATQPKALCDTCVCSKATARTQPHPCNVEHPLKLMSMDIMGPLQKSPQFSYVLTIHDTFFGMIWVWGLHDKAQAATEVLYWVSETHQLPQRQSTNVARRHDIEEIWVDQGELWATSFQNLCLSSNIKITASPMQQHTDKAFVECAIQTLQKTAYCMLFDTNIGERWWPYAVSQAAYVHNRLAGTTRGGKMPYKIFYAEVPSLRHIRRSGCAAYIVKG